MLAFLPPPLRAVFAISLLVLNTLLLGPPLVLVSLLRLILPLAPWQRFCTRLAIAIAELWISVNSGWMRLTQAMQWEVQGLESVDKKHWYLVVANHQSWADILVVQHLLNRRMPMLKFFLKQQLIWLPIIGLCWWALDFPFMKRYSKAYLEKYPEKKGRILRVLAALVKSLNRHRLRCLISWRVRVSRRPNTPSRRARSSIY